MKKEFFIPAISVMILIATTALLLGLDQSPLRSFVFGKKNVDIGYTEEGICKTGKGYKVDPYLYGKERKNILDKNDKTVIATVNGEAVALQDFMQYKLTDDYVSALTGKENHSNSEIFESVVEDMAIYQDCARRGITVSDQEAIQKVDENYQRLLQAVNTPAASAYVSGPASGNTTISVQMGDAPQAEAKTALDEFNQELKGLGLTYEQYRVGYGMEVMKEIMLKGRYTQAVAKEKGWSDEEAPSHYETYLKELVKNVTVQKTKAFPSD